MMGLTDRIEPWTRRFQRVAERRGRDEATAAPPGPSGATTTASTLHSAPGASRGGSRSSDD